MVHDTYEALNCSIANKGYRMVLDKLWVSANFRRVSKSRRRIIETQNLKLAKNKGGLGISNFEI